MEQSSGNNRSVLAVSSLWKIKIKKPRNHLKYIPKHSKNNGICQYLIQSVRFASFFGTLPHKWNPTNRKFELPAKNSTSGKIRRAMYLAQFWAYVIYLLWIVAKLIRTTVEAATNPTPAIYKKVLGYVAVAYSAPIACQIKYLVHYEDHHALWNYLIEFADKAQAEDKEAESGLTRSALRMRKSKHAKPRPHKMIVVLIMCGIVAIYTNIHSLVRNPKSPQMLTSLIPGVENMSKLLLSPLMFVNVWFWLWLWITLVANQSEIRTFLYIMIESLKKLRNSKEMQFKEFTAAYRQLQLLQNYFDELSSQFFVRFEAVYILVVVIGLYIGLTETGVLRTRSLIIGSFCIFNLLNLFLKLAMVNQISTELIEQKKLEAKSIEFRKFLRSANPIRVRVGSFFYADHGLVLTIVSIVIENTVSLLVAS